MVTQTSEPRAVKLAKRLKAAGAKMYGAFWCSHCFDQKQDFGKEAMADFPYVECYPDGFSKVCSCVIAITDSDDDFMLPPHLQDKVITGFLLHRSGAGHRIMGDFHYSFSLCSSRLGHLTSLKFHRIGNIPSSHPQ